MTRSRFLSVGHSTAPSMAGSERISSSQWEPIPVIIPVRHENSGSEDPNKRVKSTPPKSPQAKSSTKELKTGFPATRATRALSGGSNQGADTISEGGWNPERITTPQWDPVPLHIPLQRSKSKRWLFSTPQKSPTPPRSPTSHNSSTLPSEEPATQVTLRGRLQKNSNSRPSSIKDLRLYRALMERKKENPLSSGVVCSMSDPNVANRKRCTSTTSHPKRRSR